MLRKMIYNGRVLPVPVPIKTLEEALNWTCDVLMKPDEMITKIIVDGSEVTDQFDPALQTTPQTKLEVRADSPSELAAQTLDALCNMSTVMFRGLKTLAVTCWQTLPVDLPAEVVTLQDDLSLMSELIDNCVTLVPEGVDTVHLISQGEMLRDVHKGLHACYASRDWKQFARILLNRLEPFLQELVEHSSSLQNAVFSDISEKALRQV